MKKNLFTRSALLAAIFAMPTASTAAVAVAAKPCISPEDMSVIGVAVIPSVMTNLANSCADSLPPNASLTVSGTKLAEQYADQMAAARPKAMAALKRLAPDLPRTLSANAFFDLVDSMALQAMEDSESTSLCPTANNLWHALKPVPMENWGYVLATILIADAKSEQAKKSKSRSDAFDPMPCEYIATEDPPLDISRGPQFVEQPGQ